MTSSCIVENTSLPNNDSEINEKLWCSKEWETFYMNNIDINRKIINVFKDNCPPYSKKIMMSSRDISEQLDMKIEYIRLALCIWFRYSCTFYKRDGVIDYNKENNKWVYVLD